MRFILWVAGAVFAPVVSAHAQDCAKSADVLGISRVLVLDAKQHTRVGTIQYPETLPLQDREIVLTFDDGPVPIYTDRVLDILAEECVKATFFMIGRNARAHPQTVRKVYEAGHTIANHTLNHPALTHMTHVAAVGEIEGGISAIGAALGKGPEIAPFFRFPQLRRSDALEAYLAERGLIAWSADFPADDWMRISASTITARALDRIERRGKGVLLLHDIQPATVLALPTLLRELKQRGYRIVHVVPSGTRVPEPAKPTPYPNPLVASARPDKPDANVSASGMIAAGLPSPTPYPVPWTASVPLIEPEADAAVVPVNASVTLPTPYPKTWVASAEANASEGGAATTEASAIQEWTPTPYPSVASASADANLHAEAAITALSASQLPPSRF